MAENNVNQQQMPVETVQQVPVEAVQQVPAENVQAAKPKKKVRVGFIFLSLLPVYAIISIQTITQVPFLFFAMAELEKTSGTAAATDMNTVFDFFNQKYAFWAYLLYSVVGIIAFGLWYYFGFVRRGTKVRIKEIIGYKSILAVISMVIGLQFLITAGFVIATELFPNVIEDYMQLMTDSGLVDNQLIMIVYAILIGPVLEELCIRGVTFGFLEKSNIKPFFIILISGILFGVMHLNLVQGIYASVLGFFLGYMRYKYRSIKITIVMHILFNFMGTYGEMLMEKLDLSNGANLILGGISLFVLLFAVLLVNGDPKAYKQTA